MIKSVLWRLLAQLLMVYLRQKERSRMTPGTDVSVVALNRPHYTVLDKPSIARLHYP